MVCVLAYLAHWVFSINAQDAGMFGIERQKNEQSQAAKPFLVLRVRSYYRLLSTLDIDGLKVRDRPKAGDPSSPPG